MRTPQMPDVVQDDTAPILLVNTSQHGDIPVVSAQGDIDLSTVSSLWEVLMSCTSRASASTDGGDSAKGKTTSPDRRIALDLREVGFIDSAGLALLAQARK